MVHHAQSPQRLDQIALPLVDGMELPIAARQLVPLAFALVGRAGEEHPKILDARPHHAIVEVDEHRPLLAPQNVAEVTVAMQPDATDRADAFDRLIDSLQQRRRGLGVLIRHRLLEQRRGQQRIASLPTEPLAAERHPMAERDLRADRMHPAERAADELQRVLRVDLDGTRSEPREHRITQALMPVQRGIRETLRRCDGKIGGGEFLREGMFLEQLRIAPASGTIELQHQCTVRGRTDLVDPVFIGVEGEQPTIALDPEALGGRQHLIGGESREGLRVGGRDHHAL